MEAGAWRSADAGAHWTPLPGHPLPGTQPLLANSPRSPRPATAPRCSCRAPVRPLRSTDGGARFRRVRSGPTGPSRLRSASPTRDRLGPRPRDQRPGRRPRPRAVQPLAQHRRRRAWQGSARRRPLTSAMPDVVDEIRAACAWVAGRARHVHDRHRRDRPTYASASAPSPATTAPIPTPTSAAVDREQRAAFWLTLDAINFGSGWFPTLRKRPGHSGYLDRRRRPHRPLRRRGAWTPAELARLERARDRRRPRPGPRPRADGPVRRLAARPRRPRRPSEHDGTLCRARRRRRTARRSPWPSASAAGRASPTSRTYDGRAGALPQARADRRAPTCTGPAWPTFADLAPADHVRRQPRSPRPAPRRRPAFDPSSWRRIDAGELIEHGSPEEVEIRACALHAVELIAAARPDSCAADIDQLLWLRGGRAPL